MCRGLSTATTFASGRRGSTMPFPFLPTIDEKPATTMSATTSATTGVKTSNNKSNNAMKSRRQAFMARSLAHRTVSFVEKQVETMMSSSRFLQSHEPRSDIAALKREELQCGKKLGHGGFSEVYELDALMLSDDEHDDDDDDDDDCLFDEESHFPQDVRERLAANTAGSQRLVVKHLRHDLLSAKSRHTFQTAAADLVTEAEFLSRLDHPHIIRLRGWTSSHIAGLGDGEHDGYFVVLDRLDCTLADKIQEWKQEEQEASSCTKDKNSIMIPHLATKLRYAQELASALEYLHEHRLVFRDLKPENIGILNDSIVLFDFGLCRELPESSTSSVYGKINNKDYLEDQYEMSGVGTLRYMAPEIMMRKSYNQKADTYSFSMVLYELLFCHKPFELYSLDMFRMLVCDNEHGERPSIPSHCPSALRHLLEDSWEHDPWDRPTFTQIREDLQQQQQEQKSTAAGFWKPRLQFILEAAITKPLRLHKSFGFASNGASERTSTTILEESSSTGSWFISYS